MEALRTGEMVPREVKKLEPDALVNPQLPRSPPVPWPPEPRERCDFYYRIRTFPEEVQAWRRRLVARVMEDRQLFSSVPRGATKEEVRPLVDEGIAFLREISRLTALLYGSPRLGNKEDPVDELVYIILARKTRENAYQQTFDALKRSFATWDALLEAPRRSVLQLVHSGGLSEKKTMSLFGALSTLKEAFGSCTFEPARDEKGSK